MNEMVKYMMMKNVLPANILIKIFFPPTTCPHILPYIQTLTYERIQVGRWVYKEGATDAEFLSFFRILSQVQENLLHFFNKHTHTHIKHKNGSKIWVSMEEHTYRMSCNNKEITERENCCEWHNLFNFSHTFILLLFFTSLLFITFYVFCFWRLTRVCVILEIFLRRKCEENSKREILCCVKFMVQFI